MNKEWANEILSYTIQMLKGRKIGSRPKGRIYIALYAKELLKRYGFWWQAKILEIWIKRAEKGEFFIASERSERAYERRLRRSGFIFLHDWL